MILKTKKIVRFLTTTYKLTLGYLVNEDVTSFLEKEDSLKKHNF